MQDELPALVNQIGLTTPTKWAQVGPMTVPLPATPPLQVLAVDGAAAAADNSFEWLHFSHADDHSYAAVLSALQAWWPKLQSGGIISGDDFVDGSSSRLKQCTRAVGDTCAERPCALQEHPRLCPPFIFLNRATNVSPRT